jgi:tetratricopeptide (TPR) repeat protein
MGVRAVIVGAAIAWVFAASHAAAQPSRDTQKEHRIEAALTAVAPAALPAFRRATAAMDSQRYAEAVSLFREVLAAAPTFTPAMRRLGYVLTESGRRAEGLPLLGEAVRIERSPENLVSLAMGLAYRAGNIAGTPAELKSALALAKEAASANRDPDDESYLAAVGQLAAAADDVAAFRQAADVLARKHPRTMAAHYFGAMVAAMDHEWARAESEIREAERLGLPHEAAEEFLAGSVHIRATAWRYARYAAYLLGLWAAGLLLLFVAGRVLSGRMLSTIERADPNDIASESERTLRSVYRALINVAGVYYYFSLPVVVLLVAGGTAAVVYGFMMLGRIPIKLVAFLVIGALITLFKMVQSLFITIPPDDRGRALEEPEAPALWALAREVAASVGTRPVDEIRITPGTDMAVYERGSASERRRDVAPRVLLLGVGLLNDFRQGAFRAVLAHEYGHFAHRDTAGGDVALRVQQDMMKFIIALAVHGQAVSWNLAFQFLRVYDFLFRRISHGAIRLQEVLADRMAAHVYGPAAFEAGLRHVIQRSVEFDAAVNMELQRAVHEKRAVADLYALPQLPRYSWVEVERMVASAIDRPTTDDDTHPGPSDQFRLVSGVSYRGAPGDPSPVWDLFASRHALAREMTAAVEGNMREVSVDAG